MAKKIYIDLGHGGTDSGAVGNGLKEKDLNLQLGLLTEKHLKNYEGAEVKLSRTTDKTLSLSQRTNEANSWGADLLISIHINAAAAESADGFESFVYNGGVGADTKALQNVLHNSIMKYCQLDDRGQKQANFHMLRESRMAAVLTENGFISNKGDSNKMKSSSWLDQVAKGHAEGIASFLGLKKKEEAPTKTTTGANIKLYKVQVGAFADKNNAEAMAADLRKAGYSTYIVYE